MNDDKKKAICFDYVKCSSRIRELRSARPESHATLAASIGVSEQLMKNYEQAALQEGKSTGKDRVTSIAGMNINTLCRLADHFGVSTDYLLGRTDNKTTDVDIQSACMTTGLSQTAIEKIVYWSVDDLFLDSLDRFLSSDSSADFIGALNTAIGNSVAIPAQWEAQKAEFASQSGFPDELSELEYYLKELKYSVFEVSESAASLVSDIAGIDQLKKKLNARIAEIVKERYHGGE